MPDEEIPKVELAARDLLSATDTLLEIPAHVLRAEIDDIELAHERLGRLIRRICDGAAV